MLPTFLVSNPWRAGVIALGLALAGTTIYADRLKGQRDLCRERAATAQERAEREAEIAAERVATAQAEAQAARSAIPPVIERITKERTVHYASNPADNVRCLTPGRVRAANEALSQLAASAGLQAVPDSAPAEQE